MTENNNGPVTDDQKKRMLRDHLTEVVRLTGELTAGDGAGKFGVSMGPDIPDLATARNTPEAKQAMGMLKKAEGEIGLVNTALAFAGLVADMFGFPLP